jgi:hypothetical protein
VERKKISKEEQDIGRMQEEVITIFNPSLSSGRVISKRL